MAQEKVNKYYDLLSQWMTYFGFDSVTVHADAGIDRVFKRSRFEATKFGNVDVYCCVEFFEKIDAESFKTFSSRMFDLAMKHRKGNPVGLGAMLIVYPLIITENIPEEVYLETKRYCPKHFAANEFPCVFDLAAGNLYYYEQTPVWGSAYYSGIRRDAYNFFSPKAWETISKGGR